MPGLVCYLISPTCCSVVSQVIHSNCMALMPTFTDARDSTSKVRKLRCDFTNHASIVDLNGASSTVQSKALRGLVAGRVS